MQIKSKERVRDYGEVFTSTKTANEMLDTIPAEMYEPKRIWLEPACGEGVFLTEMLKRKFARCERRSDYTDCLKSFYGMDIQADNVQITIENIKALCRGHIKLTKDEETIIERHIMLADSLKVMAMLNGE